MKIHTLAFAAALFATAGSASAGFFFFLPIGAIQNAVQGGHCVPETAKVGDRINVAGKQWVVKETNGVSYRCSQFPNWPVIAKLEPYLSPAELAQELQVCLPQGTTAGRATHVPGIGEVFIRSVSETNSDCSDQRTPVSARVVRGNSNGSGPPPVAQPAVVQPQASETQKSVERVPQAVPTVAHEPVKVLVKEPRSVVERLRELKQLRDEQLISESVYEVKQREILQSQ